MKGRPKRIKPTNCGGQAGKTLAFSEEFSGSNPPAVGQHIHLALLNTFVKSYHRTIQVRLTDSKTKSQKSYMGEKRTSMTVEFSHIFKGAQQIRGDFADSKQAVYLCQLKTTKWMTFSFCRRLVTPIHLRNIADVGEQFERISINRNN